MLTLPTPPPPPVENEPELVSPQDQDSRSISPLCLSSALSPSMPSIFKNISLCAINPPRFYSRRSLQMWITAVVYLRALAGNSAARRYDTDDSSNWKCGLRNAVALYTPGFPGTSETSILASRKGYCALVACVAVSSGVT